MVIVESRYENGFSLIELIVIVSILSVLLAIGIPMLTKYLKKYGIEKEIVAIYSQLSSQRFKSMNTGVPHGIRFDSSKQYTVFVFKDSNYNLKFDSVNEEDSSQSESLQYALNGPQSGTVILFDKKGLARNSNWGLGSFTIYISSPARHNCINVSVGRIKMGVWNGSSSKCEAK